MLHISMLSTDGKPIDVTFSKPERLSRKNDIKELFETGSSFYLHPFKVIYQLNDQADLPHQVLFTVPKRTFKKSVTRNKIKRRVREAYRLNKHKLLRKKNEQFPLKIAYIYIGKEVYDFKFIQNKLIETFSRLNNNTP